MPDVKNSWLCQVVDKSSNNEHINLIINYSTTEENMDHVYLRHLSTEYRSILSADMPTDSRPISRPILGRHIDQRQRTRMSADTRPILHRHSADSWPVHYRHSADHVLLYRPSIGGYYRSVCRPTVGRYLDRYSADMSAETRPTYRPTSTDTHVS